MELYIAVNIYSNEVRMFAYFDDLKSFAEKAEYSCNYYSLGSVCEMTVHEVIGGNNP